MPPLEGDALIAHLPPQLITDFWKWDTLIPGGMFQCGSENAKPRDYMKASFSSLIFLQRVFKTYTHAHINLCININIFVSSTKLYEFENKSDTSYRSFKHSPSTNEGKLF